MLLFSLSLFPIVYGDATLDFTEIEPIQTEPEIELGNVTTEHIRVEPIFISPVIGNPKPIEGPVEVEISETKFVRISAPLDKPTPIDPVFKVKIGDIEAIDREIEVEIGSIKMKPINECSGIEISGVKMGELQPIDTEVEVTIGAVTSTRPILIEQKENKLLIQTEYASASTIKKLVIKERKLYMETSEGNKQIKIMPEVASSKAIEITAVKEIELKEEHAKPVYSVKGIKQSTLFLIVPISMEVETKINAETGVVISVNKPWWSFLTR